MKISQTSTGSGPSVSIYFLATNCGNASNYPRFWQPFAASCAFRSSIFAGSGIRLRERQSFPAFLRKRQDPVQTARSTMDLRERFSNQCTMASLSKSFCTLAVVWTLCQLIPSGRECRIELGDVREHSLSPYKESCRELHSSFLNRLF